MTVRNIDLVRNSGTAWEPIYFKTSMEQVVGLLDGNNKIAETNLPASVFAGMRFVGVASGLESITIGSIYTTVTNYVNTNGGGDVGCYVIFPATASGTTTVTASTNHLIYAGSSDPVSSVVVETGDWLIYVKKDGITHYWALINNTYDLASTSQDGLMSSGDKTKLNNIAANANNYSLPIATSSVLGGVKVGNRLSISDGVLSADAQAWTTITNKPLTFAPIIGAGAGDAVAGNDPRLTDSRIASDVYAWAKAAAKPSYVWNEIGSKPLTFAPIIGAGAGDAVAGDDIRLTNARTPVTHAVNANTYGYGDTANAGHIRVGTNINVSNGTISVAEASTTVKGVIELATNVEAKALSSPSATLGVSVAESQAIAEFFASVGYVAGTVDLPSPGNVPVGKLYFLDPAFAV